MSRFNQLNWCKFLGLNPCSHNNNLLLSSLSGSNLQRFARFIPISIILFLSKKKHFGVSMFFSKVSQKEEVFSHQQSQTVCFSFFKNLIYNTCHGPVFVQIFFF